MTIQLTKATYVSGVLAAAGSQHTLDAQTEAYLVHIGAATWVDAAYTQGRFEDAKIEYDSDGVAVGVVGRGNEVVGPVWATDASGNVTGLVGPGNLTIRHKRIGVPPKIIRLLRNPFGGMELYHPTYAVGVGDKLYGVCGSGTAAGYSWVYDWSTGVRTKSAAQVCGGAIQASTVNGLWASSHGLFVCMAPSGGTKKLYKAAYATPTTWAEVFDFATDLSNPEPTVDYDAKMWAECDNGTLFMAGYNSTCASGDGYARCLLKSTDGGDTWVNIAGDLAILADRHVHAVTWDKYRNLVWCCIGDIGDLPSISVSTDYGVTWQPIPGSFQCTGVVPLPDTVLLLSDRAVAGTRETGIWRLDGASLSDLRVATPYQVYDPRDSVNMAYSRTVATHPGYAWCGYYDDEAGIVYVPYTSSAESSGGAGDAAAALVASSDGGVTWQDIAAEFGSSGSAFIREEMTNPQNHYIDWDGWHWIPGDQCRIRPWRVYAGESALCVANSTGYAYGNGTLARPFRELPESVRESRMESRWSLPPREYLLLEDYADPLVIGNESVVVNTNGHQFTATAAGALLVDEGFEGAGVPSGWAETKSGTATLDWDSTAQAHGGAQSVLCTINANGEYAWAQRNFTAVTEGEIIAIEAYLYVDLAAANFASGNFIIAQWHSGHSVRLYGGTAPYLTASNTDVESATLYQRTGNTKNFPLRQWVKIQMRLTHAYTADKGRFELWQDDEKIIDVLGIKTGTGTPSLVYLGASTRSGVSVSVPVYVDDVKILKGGKLPNQQAGLTLSHPSSVAI